MINPNQLKALVSDCKNAWYSLGQVGFKRPMAEESSRKFRRSLCFMKNLKAGDVIAPSDVRAIRPGYGLNPKHIDKLVGKRLVENVERGDPVSFDIFVNDDCI